MVIDSLYRLNTRARRAKAVGAGVVERKMAAVFRSVARLICGMQGHLILLHYEPTKLSLQCALCGYQSEGWEVRAAKLPARPSAVQHFPREERRHPLQTLDHTARLAS